MVQRFNLDDMRREQAAYRARRRAKEAGYFGFGFGSSGASSAPILNLATLNLTLWLQAAYSGSPWAGTASAGTSGSNSVLEGTNPPSVGTSLGGLASPDFDGTNDKLLCTASILSASAGSFWVIVNVDTITANTASNTGQCVLYNTNFAVYLRSNSGSPVAGLYTSTAGGVKTAESPITTGAWALLQGKWDSSNISFRVNSQTRATTAAGAISSVSTSTFLGANSGTTVWYDGRIREVGISTSAFSDQTEDDIKRSLNNTYSQSF